MSDFSKNIKRMRREKGLTQDELAEGLHVTRQAVSNWENDRNHPDIELLKDMAELFEVDIKALLYPPEREQGGRRWLAVWCTLVAVTVLWAVVLCFGWSARQLRSVAYVAWPFGLYQGLLLGLAFLLSGLAAARCIRQWRDLSVQSRGLRWGLFLLALIPIFLLLGGYAALALPISIPNRHLWLLYIIPNPWLNLPGGFILGCLFPKAKQGEKGTQDKKRWLAAGLVLSGLGIWAMEWFSAEMVAVSRTVPFRMSMAEWLVDWLKAILFLQLGGTGAAVFYLKKDLRPKTGGERTWLLGAAAALLALFGGLLVFQHAIRQGAFLSYPTVRAVGRWLLRHDNSFLFALPGFLLFCGLLPKREQGVDFPTKIL